MNVFTIKDLENLSGIKAHTIRIWEQRYSFLKPHRTDTNIRYYSNQELRILLNIALLNKSGYKISLINKMSEQDMEKVILSLTDTKVQDEKDLNDLITHLTQLDDVSFEQTIAKHIRKRGLQCTILQLVFPFLDRIGFLWASNLITPAHEHLMSNIIRQKLIAGIDSLDIETNPETPVVLLFLPEAEFHELGLLFMHFVLKSRGIRVVYLGPNTPLADVAFVARQKSIRHFYIHLTAVANSFKLNNFVKELAASVPRASIILSGPLTQHFKNPLPKQVTLLSSLQKVLDFAVNFNG